MFLILRMLTGLAAFALRLTLHPALRALARTFVRRERVQLRSPSHDAALLVAGWTRSSETIHSVLSRQLHTSFVFDAPHDADDFGRCARLLELVPEWIPRLGEVAHACPSFRRLVRCWPELTRLHERGETAMLTAIIRDLRGPGGDAVRMTVRREWELVAADEHGDGKSAPSKLPPGTHDMERIRNPLGYQGFWLVLKGTRLGAAEGSWRQWSDGKYDDDEFGITFGDGIAFDDWGKK